MLQRFPAVRGLVLLALAAGFSGCGRAGFAPDDGGTSDGADGGGTAVSLMATPALLEDDWVDRGDLVVLRTSITRSDAGVLGGGVATPGQDWIQATLSDPGGVSRMLTVEVDSTGLAAGIHEGAVSVAGEDDDVEPVTVRVWLRVLDVVHLHVGPAVSTCPHVDAAGSPSSACDFTGADALFEAAAAIPEGGGRILLYDDLGSPVDYTGCVEIPGRTWLGAAPGIDLRNVRVVCSASEHAAGAIRLVGNDCHVERMTVVCLAGADAAVSAWPAVEEPVRSTAGHLIENLVGVSLNQEVMGSNDIREPVWLGPDTTVRNCHFWGYFETDIDLRYAHRSRLVHNTFVFFQSSGGIITDDAEGIVISNNVVISLSRTHEHLVHTTSFTDGLTVTGNLAEGYAAVLGGDGAGASSHLVEGNLLTQVEVESPYLPVFLLDATQRTSGPVSGEGVSLDGEDIWNRTNILPGAYQGAGNRSRPRRMTLRVGPEGQCGGLGCDITTGTANEIQRAVWSSWRGGRIEVYPAAETYAGDAIISWPVELVGVGDVPEEVVLQSREEDTTLRDHRLWDRHRSLLAVAGGLQEPVRIENLTLRVDASAQASDRAVWIESAADDPHTLRRVRVESTGSGSGLHQGLYLGDGVLLQDSLIHGDFDACVRYGTRGSSRDPTPSTTGWMVNLTCRLTGQPAAGFEIAGVTGSIFANLAVELAAPAPLFSAQRRSEDDTGAKALDLPRSFLAQASSVRGYDELFDGFDAGDGAYTLTDVETVDDLDPFFESGQSGRLDPAASAIDSGVDPAQLDPALSAGVALDGEDRQGHVVDRGAFEQGL